MAEKKVYEDLLIDRSRIKAAVTRALSIYTKYNWTEHNLEKLKLRREKLSKQGDLFDEVQEQIEHSTFSITTESEKERESFEEKYFATLGEYNKTIKELEGNYNATISQNSSTIVANHPSRLPTIPLPHFSGNYSINSGNHLLINSTLLSQMIHLYQIFKKCTT